MFFFLFSFLAWVCCWVSFTGVLQTVTIAGAAQDGSDLKGNFWSEHTTHRGHGTRPRCARLIDSAVVCVSRWDHYKLEGYDSVKFSDSACSDDYCGDCKTGGQALVAFQVFAFLALTPILLFSVLRILGISISCLEPTRKSLAMEFGLTIWTTFWFFLAVCV